MIVQMLNALHSLSTFFQTGGDRGHGRLCRSSYAHVAMSLLKTSVETCEGEQM